MTGQVLVIYLVAIVDTGQFSFFNNFQYFQLLDVDNSDKDAFWAVLSVEKPEQMHRSSADSSKHSWSHTQHVHSSYCTSCLCNHHRHRYHQSLRNDFLPAPDLIMLRHQIAQHARSLASVLQGFYLGWGGGDDQWAGGLLDRFLASLFQEQASGLGILSSGLLALLLTLWKDKHYIYVSSWVVSNVYRQLLKIPQYVTLSLV